MSIYIGETIKKLRKERELTQETLANFLGISYQSISKWERGESFPDIALIPSIASFFGVTTDTLFGVNLIEKKELTESYIKEYSRLWSEHKINEVKTLMKKATNEFPGDFDLLVRYLNALIYAEHNNEYLIKIKSEVEGIFENIQNYCTVDSIRIWAKKLMCRYLRDLSFVKNSGVDISEAEKILEGMPIMQNTRDYEAMFMYPYDKEKRSRACSNGISEMLRLLGEIISRKYDNPTEYDENVLTAFNNLIAEVMPDGDYGKCYHHMIYNNGYIGVKKYLGGDYEGALKHFETAAKLAEKYDSLPDISVHTSFLLEKLEFNKTKMLMGSSKMTQRMKHHFTVNYPLSDEFKASEEFKNILKILG